MARSSRRARSLLILLTAMAITLTACGSSPHKTAATTTTSASTGSTGDTGSTGSTGNTGSNTGGTGACGQPGENPCPTTTTTSTTLPPTTTTLAPLNETLSVTGSGYADIDVSFNGKSSQDTDFPLPFSFQVPAAGDLKTSIAIVAQRLDSSANVSIEPARFSRTGSL